ncbi:S9 family peptidase [Chondromyces crocatus]|uniref:Peptidase S9 n=1 Tax=Chondromyces crocatus TaxID=52 RepID=A0A0K1EJU7_CHOCO|nr:S9 family peptidase [Chondromyces crocatus]AKT41130.1 peptidase S9 [Chondromyces crocatus]
MRCLSRSGPRLCLLGLAVALSACATATADVAPSGRRDRAAEEARPGPAVTSAPPADARPDVPAGADAVRDAALAERVVPLLDAFVNSEASFSPDGKTLLFNSNRHGLPQLYVAETSRPDAPARRLVSTKERISDGVITPDGKGVIFLSDKGLDENLSIFRVDLGGKNLVELTPGESLQRTMPMLPDGAPGTMVYSARAAADVSSRVIVQSTSSGGVPRVVYTAPKPAVVTDARRDGKEALLIQLTSNSDMTLFVVDLGSGKARAIYPKEGMATMGYARFSADGRRVFVATDGGGEAGLVLALDAATGRELARYTEEHPRTAKAAELAVSRRGDRVAVRMNAGNRSEVRLLDAQKLTPAGTVALPLGSGTLSDFSADGKRLGVSWSTPSAPADVMAVDTASGMVSRLRDEPRPSLAALPPLEASIVEVTSFDGTRVPVNVYLPQGGASRGALPVLVLVHGGPADSSEIRWSTAVRYFGSLGYAVVEPNVRGSTGFGRAYEEADNGRKRLDALADLGAVARWVGEQPWADPARRVVMGGSYGGYMVLLALTRQPELWRAGVDMVGISSLRTFLKTTTGFVQEVFKVEFGDLEKDGAFLDSISPLADADKIVAPLFVYAGANDPRVPLAESDQIVLALRRRGVPVEYMVRDDEGHSLERRESRIAFYARVGRFLEKQLARGKEGAP